MDDACFILVDGLTKSLSSSKEGCASSQFLQNWFPKSHCHLFDPFEVLGDLPPGIDALEELGVSMLKSLLKCPECSATYLTCHNVGRPPRTHRPFVFIGHDLGGSVIKRALMFATGDSLSRSIVDATVAVFFFGGLHRAPDSNSWGRLIAGLLAISQRDVQAFLPWLPGLATAQACIPPGFLGRAGSYAVFNVYEESERAVIPKFSATLDSVGSDQFGVDRRHVELLHLEKGDPTSKWLLQRLRSLNNEESTLREECCAFIRYLALSGPKLHQLKATMFSPGSLDCINSLESYREWAHASGVNFLHIYGPPGSGVTVFTSNLVWLFGVQRPEIKLIHLDYSFSAQNILASEEEKILRSLVRQLLSQLPHLFNHARCICTWVMERRCANVKTLWALLRSLLFHIAEHSVLLTIRAAEDCNSACGFTSIIEEFLDLRKVQHLDIKIIITSQGQDWAARYIRGFHVIPMEEIKGVKLVLKDLVRSRLQKLMSTRPAWRDLVDDVTDKFWGAKGNYYWALARVQELESVAPTILSTAAALMEGVGKFPDDDQEFVRYIVGRIPHGSADWLLEALRWLVFALRPLTSRELAVAVAFNQGMRNRVTGEPFESFEERILSDLPGDINRIAGYWVKADSETVTVTNTVLKSFLVDNFMGCKSKQHSQILQRSLEYISNARVNMNAKEGAQNEGFKPGSLDRPGCDLLEYAAVYWPLHCREVGYSHPEAIDAAQHFIEDADNLEFWSSIVRCHDTTVSSFDFWTSPLNISAAFGIAQLVERFVYKSENHDQQICISSIREALDVAIERGNRDIALGLWTKLRNSGVCPSLHVASKMGYVSLLQEFLQVPSAKEAINDRDAHGYSPLLYAAQHGQGEAVRLLLRNKARTDLADDDGWTALHAASKIGRVDIAEMLIKDGRADHRLRTRDGYNALELAAEGGFDDLVAFLLALHNEAERDTAERSTSALHLASMYGHASTCVYLVRHGARTNALDQHMQTPVYLAVLGCFLETVSRLLDAECPQVVPDVEIPKGQEHLALACFSESPLFRGGPVPSPLQLAAGKNFVEILELLLEHSHFDTGFTYDRNEALSKAAAEGHSRPVEILLLYTSTTNPVDARGDTALHVAARHGHQELVHMLLDSKTYDANFQNKRGLSALHEAAEQGHAQIVAALVGGKWTDADSSDSHGDEAIHWAVKAGHLDVVKVLQETRDFSKEKDHDGNTAMVLAALAGHASIVEEFISKAKGSVPASELPWGGLFPLHTAIANEEQELARILIKHGYKIDHPNADGDTALHVAARLKVVSLIQLVLANSPNPTIQNRAKETALLVAVKFPNHTASSTILDGCADSRLDFINLPDAHKNSALYTACGQGDAEMVRLLLQNQADPNQKCQRGWTPLHISAAWDRIGIMELLFTAKADHDIRNDYGSTAIVLAAESGHVAATCLLIKMGASAKGINKTGSSALHRAAQNGHLDCVKLLIKAGADFNAQKKAHTVPLHLALVNHHSDVAEYLIEEGVDVSIVSQALGHPLELAAGLRLGQSGHFKSDSAMLRKLITAGATMKLGSAQSSRLSEDMLVFAIEHPQAFVLESPGETLQEAISSKRDKAALKMITSGMGLNETGGTFNTALQAAAVFESVDIMEELLEKQANPNIVGGRYGSALNAAVIKRNARATVLLLNKGAKTDVEYQGCLPIHWAVRNESISIVEAILNSGVDPTTRDQNGRSLLAYAVYCGSDSVVKHLLSRPDIHIDDTDLCGRTPLMMAVILGKQGMVQDLLDKEADPNIGDLEKKTPLIRALAVAKPLMTNEEIVKALLKGGADPSRKDCRNRSWLYWACQGGGRSVVKNVIFPALREHGKLSLKGELAFHAIASSALKVAPDDRRAMLRVLLHTEADFDLEEQDDDGWTAVLTAVKFGLADVEEFLVQAMIVYSSLQHRPCPKRPTRWHGQDKGPCLKVHSEGTYVQVGAAPLNPDDNRNPFATIRSDHCMPADGVYYFEVTIEENAPDNLIGVGFCEEHTPLDRIVGWDPGSWGYHGDDGKFFGGARYAHDNLLGEPYKKGDTIGCGVNFERETAYFTKDGQLIGPAFRGIKGKLYPAVSLGTKEPGAAITGNFGSSEFKYKDWESEKNTSDETPESRRTASQPLGATYTSDREPHSDSDAEWDWEVEQPEAE